MAREFNIRTTSGSYYIEDLDITINEVSQNLIDSFSIIEIVESNDLYEFMKNNSAVAEVTNEDGSSIKNIDPSNNSTANYKEVFKSNSIDVNTNSYNYREKINTNTQSLTVGEYELVVNYMWSIDTTGSDFICVLEFDGETIGSQSIIHQQESKDSSGNSQYGTGTDQKLAYSMTFYVDVTSPGEKNLKLMFCPQLNGIEASMWDSSIKITKV